MSAKHFATLQPSSLKTPFWESLPITPNLKFAIAQTFPSDNVPEPMLSEDISQQTDAEITHSKLLAVKDLLEKEVTTRNASLEPKDPLRFIAIHTLGMTSAELGQWQDAETIYTSLIVESDGAFGPNSKQAMGAISNLGRVYENLGKYPEAEATLRRSMELVEPMLGKDSPQYLGAIRSLIPVLAKQKKFDEAEGLLQNGLGLVVKMDGPFKAEETEEMKKVAAKYESSKL
jgi:tetratricopeptide (TPR) repeat protein